MKINIEKNINTGSVADIKSGAVFQYNGVYYIKIYCDHDYFLALSLRTYEIETFSGQQIVTLFEDSELIIK